MSRERFSVRHPFTQAEVERLVESAAKEAWGKRLLVTVTTAHRQNSIDQWSLNQIAYWTAVLAIFLAEWMQPTIDRSMLYVWGLGGVANWGVRAFMYFVIFRASPADVSRLLRLRSIPLGIMAISLSYWTWSVFLFVTGALTPTVLVIYLGFVMLSIAIVGNLLAAPIAAGVLVVGLWLVLSARTIQTGLMPWTVVAVIDCFVAGILWLSVYSTIKRIKPHLDRSDEIDLLLSELRRANGELETMRNDAAATLARRSSFFAGASHDFRQRLHAMKLMAHSATETFRKGDRSRWALTRLSEEMQELETYITHFLEFTRSEAVFEQPSLQDVDLLSLFQEVDLRFEEVAAARQVRLKFRVPQVRLRTDPRLLLQMLENLVSNALKFTRGGVVVASRRRGQGV